MSQTTTQTAIQAPRNTAAMTPKPQEKIGTPQKGVLEFLQSDGFKAQLALALPKFFGVDRFTRAAITEFRLNTALQECSTPSVLGYFMQAASYGLEPSGALGQCWPVPFYNKKTGAKECQFIPGYRGMASIARRSGEVITIDAQIVHMKDEFELVYGLEQNLTHKPCLDDDPGPMRGAWCIVRFKDGSYQFAFMTKAQINKHRARSKAASSGPWVSDYEEMAKKTVFRSLFKWLPISIEQAEVLASDGAIARYDATKPTIEEGLEIEYTVAQDEPEAAGADAQ